MNRVAVVTGASSGIGKATAEMLAAAGVDVVANGRDLARLSALKGCRVIAGSVSDPGVVQSLVAELRQEGSYPILINSAGVAMFASFCEAPLATWESHLETNLLAPLRLCHAAVPVMLEKGGGLIVNVSSIAATHFFPGGAVYCTSKAGLLAFGKGLAADYRKQGLRVTTVMPGAVDTPIWGDSGPEKSDMLSARTVAEAIRDLVMAPADRTMDELTIMPVKGFL